MILIMVTRCNLGIYLIVTVEKIISRFIVDITNPWNGTSL